MPETDKVLEELRSIGYTDEKLRELLSLVTEEVYDQVFLDLAGSATEEEVDALAAKADEARTDTDVDEILKEAASLAYGDASESKLDTMIAGNLREALELTKNIRQTYQSYMAGDPETRKKVEDVEKSPEFKKMTEEMEAAGFDFKAQAAK